MRTLLEQLTQDIRYGVRGLRRSRCFVSSKERPLAAALVSENYFEALGAGSLRRPHLAG